MTYRIPIANMNRILEHNRSVIIYFLFIALNYITKSPEVQLEGSHKLKHSLSVWLLVSI